MSDVRTIWNGLKTKYEGRIELSCKECQPPFDPSGFRCQHEQKGIWVFSKYDTERSPQWIYVREISKKLRDQLCPNPLCQGGRRCRGAHGEAELHIWKEFRQHELCLHTFIPKILHYEKENKSTDPPVPILLNDAAAKRMEETLKRCGGGRFVLVCKSCYNLKPRIVKEMEVGNGKDPMISCKWCNGKRSILLYESTVTNRNGVTFSEYQVIRKRLSKIVACALCRYVPNCARKDNCTYAHNFLEQQFWKLEAWGETRLDLVRYCDQNCTRNVKINEGAYHCDRCCISFSNVLDYEKYMEKNHKHFPKICRPEHGWIFRPLPQTEEITMCDSQKIFSAYDCEEKDFCSNAHDPRELSEWRERLLVSKARAKFHFAKTSGPHQFNLEQSPKNITEEKRVQVETDKLETEIKMAVETKEWKLNVTSNEMKLLRLGFPNDFEYRIKSTTDDCYSTTITAQERPSNEFSILFTNPQIYGQHVGDLFLEFENEKTTYYMRFLVDVRGEHLSFQDTVGTYDRSDWTRDRIVVSYPRLYVLESYEKRIEDLKSRYKIQKNWDGHVHAMAAEASSYVKRMHKLLYKEELARQNVLSRLNMKCQLTFGAKAHSGGHVSASFTIPTSVSTDQGLLFKTSCQMVFVGEEGNDCAYEAKIRPSDNFEEVTLDLSPECVKNLKIQPGTSRELQIQFQLHRAIFALRHYALDTIEQNASIVCPVPNQYAVLDYTTSLPACEDLDDAQNVVFKYLHVEKKREPLDFGMNDGKCYPPLVVAGPFGSGKTHTIKTIVLDLLKNGSESDTILLCTHSNSSADMYLKDHRFQEWKGKTLRLYYHERDPHVVEDVVLQFCLFGGRGFRYPSTDEIRKYKFVVTTFSTALTINLETGITGNLFQYIFLDEASQAMEADVIMPLVLADYKKTRIVIAGDLQRRERMYSDNRNGARTILERMYQAYKVVPKRCRILLFKNYRCVDGILSLVSKLFYKKHKNIIQNASNAQCIPGMEPVYFIQVQGTCMPARNGEYLNVSEACQIAWEVKMLIKGREKDQLLKPEEVVVISAFYSQVKLIRQVLRKESLDEVSVQTIQGIQGQEYKAVIVCTVMRRKECLDVNSENLGLLSDPRLLNTALTRAKSLIVVIGDAVTLCSTGRCAKRWEAFLKYCEYDKSILPYGLNVKTIERDIALSAPEFLPVDKRKRHKTSSPFESPSDAEFRKQKFDYSFEPVVERGVISPSGGELCIDECIIEFRRDCVLINTKFALSLEMDFRNVIFPENVVPISAIVGVDYEDKLNNEASFFIPTWFAPNNPHEKIMILKSRTPQNSTNSVVFEHECDALVCNGIVTFKSNHFCKRAAGVSIDVLRNGTLSLSHALLHKKCNFKVILCFLQPEGLLKQKLKQAESDGYKKICCAPFELHEDECEIMLKSLKSDLYSFCSGKRTVQKCSLIATKNKRHSLINAIEMNFALGLKSVQSHTNVQVLLEYKVNGGATETFEVFPYEQQALGTPQVMVQVHTGPGSQNASQNDQSFRGASVETVANWSSSVESSQYKTKKKFQQRNSPR